MKIIENSVTERFLRYISYDTQSKEEGEQVPSTTKQLELGKLLTTELKEMGVANVRMEDGDTGACFGHESNGGVHDRNFVCYFCGRTILSGS